MIPGIELTDGVTTIVVAPMNLRIQLEDDTKEDVDLVMSGDRSDPAKYQNAAINVILACARRNQPSLKREQLLEVIDFADLTPLLVSVLTKSGFKPRPLGSSAAVAPAPSPSPAPASSDSSSMQLDGSQTTSSTA
jgi:hypothetical protein